MSSAAVSYVALCPSLILEVSAVRSERILLVPTSMFAERRPSALSLTPFRSQTLALAVWEPKWRLSLALVTPQQLALTRFALVASSNLQGCVLVQLAKERGARTSTLTFSAALFRTQLQCRVSMVSSKLLRVAS